MKMTKLWLALLLGCFAAAGLAACSPDDKRTPPPDLSAPAIGPPASTFVRP